MASELSESTRKAYESSIKQLRTLTKTHVKNTAAVKKAVEASKYSDSSKNLMYCAIKALYKSELTDKQMDTYKAIIKEYMEKKKSKPSQVMTEKEDEKFLEWDSVLKVREALAHDISDYTTHMNYVIVCLYTMFPPRRLEYSDMKVVEKLPKNPTENLLVLNKKEAQFIFVNYKTAKKYGTQQFAVPNDLADILKDYVKTWNLSYLFITKEGAPLSTHTLGERIMGIFERYSGRRVGASMLRHSYITHMRKDEKPLDEQRDIASKMGHSVLESMEYRKIKED